MGAEAQSMKPAKEAKQDTVPVKVEIVKDAPEIVIKPYKSSLGKNLGELFNYRGMMGGMIWRNLRMQFDDLALGFLWATARPLAMLFVFSFIKQKSGANMQVSMPYDVYFYSGIILWFAFVEAARGASSSITKESGLMKKIYFPHIIPPIVSVVLCLYNLLISAVPLVVLAWVRGVVPDWKIALIPVVLLVMLLLAYGVGIAFAALGALSKDFDKMFSIILYLGLFVSPVIYSPAIISGRAQLIFNLNPLAGILLSFRSCVYGEFPFPWELFGYSAGFALISAVVGTFMFRRAEEFLVDKM